MVRNISTTSRAEQTRTQLSSTAHTVRSGDTLSAIARQNGVSLQALIQANPQITNPNLIYPGQAVTIPAGGSASSGGVVGSGDVAAPFRPTPTGPRRLPPPGVDPRNLEVPGESRTPAPGGPSSISASELRRIVPNLSASKAEEVSRHLSSAMTEAGITTPRQKAAFVAQLAHESGGFQFMEEIASGAAYEGRRDLGNTQPGDGRRFKGRGYIQVNYTEAGRALGLDLVNQPELAARPENAARIAAWFWNSRNLNPVAERGDFVGVTRRINGGTNGLQSRQQYYADALRVLS
jgi:putative chitinase